MIDYLKLRECPNCSESWVLQEWGDGTFHTACVMVSENDYKGAKNAYQCPYCNHQWDRLVDEPKHQHQH